MENGRKWNALGWERFGWGDDRFEASATYTAQAVTSDSTVFIFLEDWSPKRIPMSWGLLMESGLVLGRDVVERVQP